MEQKIPLIIKFSFTTGYSDGDGDSLSIQDLEVNNGSISYLDTDGCLPLTQQRKS